jgi:Cysteine rich repeat
MVRRMSILREFRLATAALLALALSTLAAKAQDAAVRQACSSDLRTVCSGVTPGGGRIKQCMIDNFDKLSDGCKAASKARQMAPK